MGLWIVRKRLVLISLPPFFSTDARSKQNRRGHCQKFDIAMDWRKSKRKVEGILYMREELKDSLLYTALKGTTFAFFQTVNNLWSLQNLRLFTSILKTIIALMSEWGKGWSFSGYQTLM